MDSLLTVKNLNVSFNTYAGEVKAVRGVSFDLGVKEALAMVGESGCGKTVTSKAVMRLLSRSGGIIKEGSQIEFMGQDILGLSTRELNRIRNRTGSGQELNRIGSGTGLDREQNRIGSRTGVERELNPTQS